MAGRYAAGVSGRTKLGEVRDLILKKHAQIAHLFGTGIGFEFMWLESEMLIEVVTNLAAMGITALPLHDAVVVAKSKGDVAAEVMQESFTRRTGSRVRDRFKIEYRTKTTR